MREETDAGTEFVRRLDKAVPVKTAFWLKESEEGPWYLYVASDQTDDKNIKDAYREVLRVADEMGSPDLDPFRVKLIPSSDPLAQAALEIYRRYPGKMATRLGVGNFGGMSVEGVYLYPASVNAPAP